MLEMGFSSSTIKIRFSSIYIVLLKIRRFISFDEISIQRIHHRDKKADVSRV